MSTSPWWRDAVIYQIYPRSFCDTDGDGTGDLPGVLRQLDHLGPDGLGVDAIWLCPFSPSPGADFGYDVADYCGVDPLFGTMDDFDALVAGCRARGIRVLLDLVVNHTSDQHPWFAASRADPKGPFGDFYLWADGRPGRPPNNWQSVFGGSAWRWDEGRQQHYLHSFLPEQPDLNWRNPAVEEAVHDVMRFWLARGADGFRLDVYNCYLKDAALRSNPRTWDPTGLVYGYRGQRHVHDRDQPELRAALGRMRAVVEAARGADGLLVGETLSDGEDTASARYTGDGALHLAFHFELLRAPWRAGAWREAIGRQLAGLPQGGWPCQVLSNHDFERACSRHGRGLVRERADARAKVAATALLCLQGTAFVYYGEEIGLPEGRIPRAKIQDPPGKRFWPLYRGRDGCRTPMPWSDAPNGGFSTAEPWLPLSAGWRDRHVAGQRGQPGSIFEAWRALIRLRRTEPAICQGDMRLLEAEDPALLSWERRGGGREARVLLNFARRPIAVALPGAWGVSFSTHDRPAAVSERVVLDGDEAIVVARDAGA